FPQEADFIERAVVAKDGTIVVAADSEDSIAFVVAVPPDGRPAYCVSPEFEPRGEQGSVITDIALDDRGRVLLTGSGRSHYSALARLNPDGSLDRDFSYDGRVVLDVGDDSTQGLALEPDGAIFTACVTEGSFGVA